MTDEVPKSSLLKALHAVQANAPTLPKNGKGKITGTNKAGKYYEYEYSYATADDIKKNIDPLLSKHGLVWTALPGGTAENPVLSYKLAHAETGEALEGEMPLMIGGNLTSQGMGSALTYSRRYAKVAVLDLVADDDDDGQAAQNYGRGSQRAAKPRPQQDSGEAATEPQKKRIKGDLRRAGVDSWKAEAAIYRELFERSLPEGRRMVDFLTKRQAGMVIDRIAQGALPTGESDVPSDGFQESLQGGDQTEVPWRDPGVSE